jgi:hypothetical protein
LKFLLEQKVGPPFQQKWIAKLLGYDFLVEYKKGSENKVADDLSRRERWEEEVSIALLSIPISDGIAMLKLHYKEDLILQKLVTKW